MKKSDLAVADFTKAVSLEPTDKEIFRFRSDCYNETGQTELAQKDLESILRIDSADVHARINLAFCYIQTKNFQKADTLYRKLLQKDSNEPYVLSNYGYVKHMLGKSNEGLKMIKKSLEIKPKNSYAYKYLAEIYFSQNETEKACEALNTGISLGFTTNYGSELEDLKKKNCK
ncbi:MAG: tetratricopeptide repeat protein [Bacteroidia bacterium]|nr:tetratricopeptide repeat protein [Bacteroidia bacterium]